MKKGVLKNFTKFTRKHLYQSFFHKVADLRPRGSGSRDLSSECYNDQVDFTGRTSFLPSNLMEEISPNPEDFSANTKVFHEHG